VSLPFGFSHDSPPTPGKTNTVLCESHHGDRYFRAADRVLFADLDVLTVVVNDVPNDFGSLLGEPVLLSRQLLVVATQPSIIKCSTWVTAPNNYFKGTTITSGYSYFSSPGLGWRFGPLV